MSAGEKLKSLRKEKGLSVEEAAGKIKVSPNKLKALEEENYSFFVSPFYARSFLKLYSGFLGLDIDPCEEIEDDTPPADIIPPSDAIQVPEKKKNPVFSKIAGIIILLAALAYLATVYFPGLNIAPEVEEPPDKETAEIVVEEPQFVEVKSVIRRPAWVRVVADGNLIEERILTPPATEYYRAGENLRIRIGYTRGMQLYYRNHPRAEFIPVDIEEGSVGWVNEIELTREFSQ